MRTFSYYENFQLPWKPSVTMRTFSYYENLQLVLKSKDARSHGFFKILLVFKWRVHCTLSILSSDLLIFVILAVWSLCLTAFCGLVTFWGETDKFFYWNITLDERKNYLITNLPKHFDRCRNRLHHFQIRWQIKHFLECASMEFHRWLHDDFFVFTVFEHRVW